MASADGTSVEELKKKYEQVVDEARHPPVSLPHEHFDARVRLRCRGQGSVLVHGDETSSDDPLLQKEEVQDVLRKLRRDSPSWPQLDVTWYEAAPDPELAAFVAHDVTVKVSPVPLGHGAFRTVHYLLVERPGGDQEVFVVKCFTEAKVTREQARKDVFSDVRIQTEAAVYARMYNSLNPPKEVHFLPAAAIAVRGVHLPEGKSPQTALQETEKSLNLFLKQKYAAVEPLILGSYSKWSNNLDFISPEKRMTPTAFSHFTYEVSHGKTLVCDIQGVEKSVGYVFTDPQIHATDTKWSVGDLGRAGMKLFFTAHKCNDLCRLLKLTPSNSTTAEEPFIGSEETKVAEDGRISKRMVALSKSSSTRGTAMPTDSNREDSGEDGKPKISLQQAEEIEQIREGMTQCIAVHKSKLKTQFADQEDEEALADAFKDVRNISLIPGAMPQPGGVHRHVVDLWGTDTQVNLAISTTRKDTVHPKAKATEGRSAPVASLATPPLERDASLATWERLGFHQVTPAMPQFSTNANPTIVRSANGGLDALNCILLEIPGLAAPQAPSYPGTSTTPKKEKLDDGTHVAATAIVLVIHHSDPSATKPDDDEESETSTTSGKSSSKRQKSKANYPRIFALEISASKEGTQKVSVIDVDTTKLEPLLSKKAEGKIMDAQVVQMRQPHGSTSGAGASSGSNAKKRHALAGEAMIPLLFMGQRHCDKHPIIGCRLLAVPILPSPTQQASSDAPQWRIAVVPFFAPNLPSWHLLQLTMIDGTDYPIVPREEPDHTDHTSASATTVGEHAYIRFSLAVALEFSDSETVQCRRQDYNAVVFKHTTWAAKVPMASGSTAIPTGSATATKLLGNLNVAPPVGVASLHTAVGGSIPLMAYCAKSKRLFYTLSNTRECSGISVIDLGLHETRIRLATNKTKSILASGKDERMEPSMTLCPDGSDEVWHCVDQGTESSYDGVSQLVQVKAYVPDSRCVVDGAGNRTRSTVLPTLFTLLCSGDVLEWCTIRGTVKRKYPCPNAAAPIRSARQLAATTTLLLPTGPEDLDTGDVVIGPYIYVYYENGEILAWKVAGVPSPASPYVQGNRTASAGGGGHHQQKDNTDHIPAITARVYLDGEVGSMIPAPRTLPQWSGAGEVVGPVLVAQTDGVIDLTGTHCWVPEE